MNGDFVSTPLFNIYRTNGSAVQMLSVSLVSGGFSGDLGNWDLVFRVDFFGLDGSLLCVFPCAAGSTVNVVDTYVEFNLLYTHYLGTPIIAASQLKFYGQLERTLVNPPFFVSAGASIDNQQIVPNQASGYGYVDTFRQLQQPVNQLSIPLKNPFVSVFPSPWQNFAFDLSLLACIRSIYPNGTATATPVFTMERTIPARDSFGVRSLPPPFSIPITLRSSATNPATISLRAVQLPVDSWFANTAAPPAEWFIDITGFEPNTIVDFWQHSVVDRYIGALESVSDGEGVSLLPRFNAKPGTNLLTDLEWRLRLDAISPAQSQTLSLQRLGDINQNAPPPPPATVSVACDGFNTHDGTGLLLNAQLSTAAPENQYASVSFTLSGPAPDAPGTQVRLGAIDLAFSTDSTVTANTQIVCKVWFEEILSDFWIPRLSLNGSLALSNVQPGGQDDPGDPQYAEALDAANASAASQTVKNTLAAFQRESPLVITVPGGATAIAGTLGIAESSAPTENQQLTLTVTAQSTGSAASTEILVIDRNPFTVALVQLPNLASAASAETGQIAVWSNQSSDGPGWQISAGAASFQLLLPPQGIGEAMVVVETQAAAPPPPPPPATQPSSEPQDGKPVDFRLSPPALASLSSSDLTQRFAEPGWNLRRILGYPGEQAPGATLGGLQFEMLYGLTCSVTKPGLRMSEIFSRLGGFAGPLVANSTGQLDLTRPQSSSTYVDGYIATQNAQMQQLNTEWAAIYSQLLSRLGVFDLWNQINSFDLNLTDGVAYDLRTANIAVPNDASSTLLRGGLSYAFDDQNLYQELLSNPHASSASLFAPRFSALGGFGKQRAGFANDKIIVESEVFMGMLNNLTITVIGRIGNLWHHAKHVTVFARSVRPSRQFYLEQPALEGRPILRKVSEYVEIIQKTRSYPESGSALSSGFVNGAEFKSIRMNVDSNWGADVGTIGWSVPLWRRDAVPADVYPKPQVLLQLATDPATGNTSALAEIGNPEKLCFYTDTRSTTGANTDIWDAVEFVDFNNAPPSRSVATNGTPDFSVEPGYGRYSYTLAADASQINLVSQRTANAMAASLANVTFMRAPSSPAQPKEPLFSASLLHDFVDNALDELSAAAATAAGKANATVQSVQKAITDRLQDSDIQQHIVNPLTTAYQNVTNKSASTLCTTLATAAQSALTAAAAPFETTWALIFQTASNQLSALVNAAQAADESLRQSLLSAVDNAFVGINSEAGVLLSDLSVAQSVANNLQTATQAQKGTIVADLTNLVAQITDPITDPERNLYTKTFTRCRDDVNSLLGDIQQVLDSANFLFGTQSLGAQFDIGNQVSKNLAQIGSDLNDFASQFNTDCTTAIGQLASAQADANSINTQIKAVAALLPPAVLQADLTAVGTQLATVTGAANQLLATANGVRQSLITQINAVNTATAQAYLTAISTSFSTFNPAAFNTLVNTTVTNIAAQVSQACQQFLSSFPDIPGFLKPTTLLQNLGLDPNDLNSYIAAFDDLRTDYTTQLDSVVQSAQQIAAAAGTALNSGVSTGLSLLRAYGDPPQVPGLSLNLPASLTNQIAYFYTDFTDATQSIAANIVQAVPVSDGLLSAVDQGYAALGDAQSQLKQLGIQNMATNAILDRLVPDADALVKQGLSSLFPSFAGLNLDNLLGGLDVPSVASDNIHISHRVDPQTLQAALDVVINFPIAGSETTLFSIGPATVSVENCVFAAQVHVAGGVGQSVTRTSSGSITADWHVSIGGAEIVEFVATALTFDESGHLHFDIQPARVRLAAVLEFLADFLQGIGLGGGFSLNILPTGIQCILAIPFPDMSFGAFGITNLSLGCLFELELMPFAITVGANLGTQARPFALTIFILGGAGWFESSLTYTPSTGQLQANVSIAILASAILSISLGPISGGVYIYFGITANFQTPGSGLTLGILILIQGRVSILGIIDADITLMLEAEYTSGGGLIGRGEVDISIKICWCFTLSVHQSVQYTFGNSSSQSSQQNAALNTRAIAAQSAAPAAPIDNTLSYATTATNRLNFLT